VFNDGYVYPNIVCDCHEKDITLIGNNIFFLISKLNTFLMNTFSNSVHDKGYFLLDDIIGNIMIIFIVIALKLAQTVMVIIKYKVNLL